MASYTVILSAVLGGIIAIENLVVCYLVYRFHALRTWTNGFIASLAVSDILFGVIVVPVQIIDASSPANGYLIAMVLLVNITNLLSTTFDRYLAVLRPFVYTTFMGRWFTRILVCAWVIPIVVSLLPLIWSADPFKTIHTVYILCLLVVGILIPYTLIILAYVRIFREVIKQVRKMVKLCVTGDTSRSSRDAAMKETKRMATEAKVAKVFAVVTGIFVVGWMPLVYMTSVQAMHKIDLIPDSLPTIAWYTLCASTLVNAPIYAYFKSDFRRSLRKILRKRNSQQRDVVSMTTHDEKEKWDDNCKLMASSS